MRTRLQGRPRAGRRKSGGVERDISMMAPVIFDSVKKLIPGGKDGRIICEIVGKLIGFAILCYPVDVLGQSGMSLNIFKSGSKNIDQLNIFESFEKYTRQIDGYSSINDVRNKDNIRPRDKMESFFLAETLKYFYLLFDETNLFAFNQWVFNTEAHLLPIYSN